MSDAPKPSSPNADKVQVAVLERDETGAPKGETVGAEPSPDAVLDSWRQVIHDTAGRTLASLGLSDAANERAA